MRNFLILCLMAVSTLGYSQKELAWFDAAFKVMYGSSNVINMAAVDNPDINYDLAFGTALGYGGKVGINKGYNGLAIELMYTKSGQTFEYLGDAISTQPEMEYKSLDLYLLFRNAKNLGFFEIGPKIGFLRQVSSTDVNGTLNVIDDINGRQLSGVLGFGVNVFGSRGMSGQIGLRFEYGFTDMLGESAATSNQPFAFEPTIYTEGYEKSAPVYAGLVFELNWGIGAYAIAKCGSRAKFFKF